MTDFSDPEVFLLLPFFYLLLKPPSRPATATPGVLRIFRIAILHRNRATISALARTVLAAVAE
jgi:hypothetical protein